MTSSFQEKHYEWKRNLETSLIFLIIIHYRKYIILKNDV